jgi:hypothetical protein
MGLILRVSLGGEFSNAGNGSGVDLDPCDDDDAEYCAAPQSAAVPPSPALPSVPLRAYTEKYLADPSKPVGTAVSDLFALGRSVQDVIKASRACRDCHCAIRVCVADIGCNERRSRMVSAPERDRCPCVTGCCWHDDSVAVVPRLCRHLTSKRKPLSASAYGLLCERSLRR